MRRALRPLGALAVVALLVTGCSSAPAESGAARTSADTGTRADTSTGTTADSTREKALRFSTCMRDHGVSGFPDPDASGQLTIDGVLNGSSLDADSPAWKRAISACRDLQPPGFTGHRRSADQQTAALRFAQCIRDNGVRDFPDPGPDQPLIDTNRIPSAATSAGMSALHAAMQKCRAASADAGVHR